MNTENKDWSEQDKRVNKLTGFEPGDREKRECVGCGKKGHYYYECNNGRFMKDVDKLVEICKIIKPSNEITTKIFLNTPQND